MNRRLLSGVLVLGGTLATVGAAVSASDSADSASAETASITSETSTAGGFDGGTTSSQAETKVPVRNGLLADDVAGLPEQPTPVTVRIGDIGLEAQVLSVGVDETNQLDVPSAEKVGWYEYSSRPGEPGSTVLAAHVDYGGVPGAFFNLADLRPGDPIDVEMSDGSIAIYRVTSTTEYEKTELPAQDVFQKTGATQLKLITCGGKFDPDARSYLSNVVVTAIPEGPNTF